MSRVGNLTAGARRLAAAAAHIAAGRPGVDDAGPPPFGPVEAAAFLAREARLLDDRRWDDWLALWHPEARYSMPTRRSVLPTGPDRSVGAELTPEGGAWWFDETIAEMSVRIAKLRTGKAWAEEPPSRTRRFVANVEVEPDGPTTTVVRSNLLVHRGRRDGDVEWFSCGRTDVVDHSAAAVLRRRVVVVDANVVAGDHLVLFF